MLLRACRHERDELLLRRYDDDGFRHLRQPTLIFSPSAAVTCHICHYYHDAIFRRHAPAPRATLMIVSPRHLLSCIRRFRL